MFCVWRQDGRPQRHISVNCSGATQPAPANNFELFVHSSIWLHFQRDSQPEEPAILVSNLFSTFSIPVQYFVFATLWFLALPNCCWCPDSCPQPLCWWCTGKGNLHPIRTLSRNIWPHQRHTILEFKYINSIWIMTTKKRLHIKS